MSVGSIFYHFTDARRREPLGKDDFQTWLNGFGDEFAPLVDAIAGIDPYFESLFVIRDRLTQVLKEFVETGQAPTRFRAPRRRKR
jgi:hypothetical protein